MAALTQSRTVVLRVLITILALADGLIHVALFGGPGGPAPPGRFAPPPGSAPPGGFAPPGGPAGAPPGGGPPGQPLLPIDQLFLLNFIGYVVLVGAFWLAPRLLGRRSWLVDAAMIGYTALSVVIWVILSAPNPAGLGYLSKAIEVILIFALVVNARRARA